jgi:cell division protein FtsL
MSAQQALPAAPAPRRVARPATRPNLRLVQPPSHPLRWLVAGLLLAAIGIFGVVALHAAATERTFAAADLQRSVDELRQERDELSAEVAALESPDRIREVAVSQLGMVPADQAAYLVDSPPPTTSGAQLAATGARPGE